MADDEYLTHGLCPACFCIDFDSLDLSYEPRAIADIVASYKIGCTFCGLLTLCLDLKYCMVDGRDLANECVRLSRDDGHPGADSPDSITAELYAFESWTDPLRDPVTVRLDIKILHDQWERSQSGKMKQNTFTSYKTNSV